MANWHDMEERGLYWQIRKGYNFLDELRAIAKAQLIADHEHLMGKCDNPKHGCPYKYGLDGTIIKPMCTFKFAPYCQYGTHPELNCVLYKRLRIDCPECRAEFEAEINKLKEGKE